MAEKTDAKPKRSTDGDDDILADAKEAYEQAKDKNKHNEAAFQEDIKFARLEEQWPETIAKQRQIDGRPCLTINKLSAFIKQVVNDARQNKPSIKVQPVDSGADPKTAEVYSGLIRNIEHASRADIAYDWAADCAVSGGFGYIRIGLDYAHDDAFDMDLSIDRVLDPLAVTGDPAGVSADGSDWNLAFVADTMSKEEFRKKYRGADEVNWEAEGYTDQLGTWLKDDRILVAEYWTREEVERPICMLSDGQVIAKDRLAEEEDGLSYLDTLAAKGVTVTRERLAKTWEVKQRMLTGAEVLSERVWKGKYIPIVLVLGEEIYVEGKRYFRSLIRSGKDAQRQFNFWESNATELAALQPRVPFLGPKGAFKTDKDKWDTINTKSWPYAEYDGQVPPARQPIDMGPAAASLTEANRASDNIKAVLGMYDASLGQRSNETSGKAILARQREGDVSTFHFADNMRRAIGQVGRILIDLIPSVYNQKRIIRVMGEDGTQNAVPINQETPELDKQGKPIMQTGPDGRPLMDMAGKPIEMTRIIDLGRGKYDLTVSAGPSFTTRREEASTQMTEMVRAMPDAGPVIMPILAKNLDWPGAEELAEAFKAVGPAGQAGQGDVPPEMQLMKQQADEAVATLNEQIEKLTQENQQMKSDRSVEMVAKKIDGFKAETDRMKVVQEHQIDLAQLGMKAQVDMASLEQPEAQPAEPDQAAALSFPPPPPTGPSQSDQLMQALIGELQQIKGGIGAILEQETAPVQLVGDQVVKGGVVRDIQFGPDGMPVGLSDARPLQ